MAGKKYPDLRYLFMRGLIAHERWQRTRHYLKSAAECTSKAIVSLELSPTSIKSVKQAEKLESIGGETSKRLKALQTDSHYSSLKPLGEKFVSSAGAILVAMLEATEEAIQQGHSQDHAVLISESQLKHRGKDLSEEAFLCHEDEFQGENLEQGTTNMLPTSSASSSATSENHLRFLNQPALTPWEIRHRTIASSVGEDSLYTNDNGSDGVVMLVDTSEWGGDRVGLGQLCELLNQTEIRYKTKRLLTGDYSWLWRSNGKERILPLLVERKRADDVARTLKDGRFWSQVNKMVAWKKEFLETGVSCQLQYLLEGQPDQYVVRCADGCKGVGRCGNPTLIQVKCAIKDLKLHPDLDVQETTGIEDTVLYLASLTSNLINSVQKGDFGVLLGREFVQAECFVIGNANSNVVEVLDNSDDDSEDIKNQNDADDASNSYLSGKQNGLGRNQFAQLPCSDALESENGSDTELKKTVMLSLIEQNRFGKVDSNSSVQRCSSFRKEVEWKRRDDSEDFIGKRDNSSASEDERDTSPVSRGEVTPIQPHAQYHCTGVSGVLIQPGPYRSNKSDLASHAYWPKMSVEKMKGTGCTILCTQNTTVTKSHNKDEDKGQKAGFKNQPETRHSISLNSCKRSMIENKVEYNEDIKERNIANISYISKKICTSLTKKKHCETEEDNFTSCSVLTDSTGKDLHHEVIKSTIQSSNPTMVKLNFTASPCYTEVSSPSEVTSPLQRHRLMSAKLYKMKTFKKIDSPKSKGQIMEKSKDTNLEPTYQGYEMSQTVSVRKTENAGIDPNLYIGCSNDFSPTDTRVVQNSPNTLHSNPDSLPDIIGFCKTDSDLSPTDADSPELQFLDLSRKATSQQTKNYTTLLDSERRGDTDTNESILDFQEEYNGSDLGLHFKHAACDREKEKKINMILSILPHVSRSRAALTLTLNNGDVEYCVSELIEDVPDCNAGSMLDSNVSAK